MCVTLKKYATPSQEILDICCKGIMLAPYGHVCAGVGASQKQCQAFFCPSKQVGAIDCTGAGGEKDDQQKNEITWSQASRLDLTADAAQLILYRIQDGVYVSS